MTQMSSVWLVIAFYVAYNAAENEAPSETERKLVVLRDVERRPTYLLM